CRSVRNSRGATCSPSLTSLFRRASLHLKCHLSRFGTRSAPTVIEEKEEKKKRTPKKYSSPFPNPFPHECRLRFQRRSWRSWDTHPWHDACCDHGRGRSFVVLRGEGPCAHYRTARAAARERAAGRVWRCRACGG